MTIGLLLGLVAVVSARQLSTSSNTDRRSKQALAAADGGIQTALFRLNSLQQTVDSVVKLDPCVLPTINATSGVASSLSVNAALDPSAGGWCTQTAAEAIGNGGSFRYQVTPTAAVTARLPIGGSVGVGLSLGRKVVATGTYTSPGGHTVSRRVMATVTALDGTNLLNPTEGGYAVVGVNSVSLAGAAVVGLSSKHAGVLSGGSVTRTGSSSICGDTVYSTGSAPTLNCSGGGVAVSQDAAGAQAFTTRLPAVVKPSSGLIYQPSGCVFVVLVGGCTGPGGSTPGTVSINALPLGLLAPQIPAGSTLDVCQLNISAGQLSSLGTPSSPSYIYVEPPATCGGTSGINVTGTGQFCQNTVAVGLCTSLLGLTDPRSLRILASPGSTLTFNAGLLANVLPSYVTVDGPGADLSVKGSSAIVGGVIAKTVTMDNNGSIQTSPSVNLNLGSLLTLPSTLLPIYKLKSFVECSPSPPTASDPSSGC